MGPDKVIFDHDLMSLEEINKLIDFHQGLATRTKLRRDRILWEKAEDKEASKRINKKRQYECDKMTKKYHRYQSTVDALQLLKALMPWEV